MTPIEIIGTICPKLADSPSLSVYEQMAQDSLDRCFFAKMYDYAVAYKACHLFVIYSDSGVESNIASLGSGAITGMSEGGLSVNFASGQGGKDSELQATKYGRMLLDLIRSRPRMDVNRNPLNMMCGGCV